MCLSVRVSICSLLDPTGESPSCLVPSTPRFALSSFSLFPSPIHRPLSVPVSVLLSAPPPPPTSIPSLPIPYTCSYRSLQKVRSRSPSTFAPKPHKPSPLNPPSLRPPISHTLTCRTFVQRPPDHLQFPHTPLPPPSLPLSLKKEEKKPIQLTPLTQHPRHHPLPPPPLGLGLELRTVSTRSTTARWTRRRRGPCDLLDWGDDLYGWGGWDGEELEGGGLMLHVIVMGASVGIPEKKWTGGGYR